MNAADLPLATRLQPGQSLRIALDAGAALMVLEGCVRVASAPGWFGETVFSVENRFGEGETYVAERGGWIELRALAPARIAAVPRAQPARPLPATRVGRLVQLLMS